MIFWRKFILGIKNEKLIIDDIQMTAVEYKKPNLPVGGKKKLSINVVEKEKGPPPRPSLWSRFRARIKKFVGCDHFTRGILIGILVNTLSMGVEYHQQVCSLQKIAFSIFVFSLKF